MEGKTHYERIIGGTEEEKQGSLDTLQEMFEEEPKSFKQYELEKTPEDEELIIKVSSMVDEIVKNYGGEIKPFPVEKIHVLKPGSVSTLTGGELSGGIHKGLSLNIGVEKEESRFVFASGIAHELFHLKSYKAARIGKTNEDVRPYRRGISMVDRKDLGAEAGEEKEYFGMLEEAIVAECTKKFSKQIAKEAPFREEVEAMERIKDLAFDYFRKTGVSKKLEVIENELKYISNSKELLEKILSYSNNENERSAYAAGMVRGLAEKKRVEWFERHKERKMLYDLLDNLIEKSEGKFKNREEIFEEFARANFTGNYLLIARAVEDILGKGSFRKLANEFAIKNKKEKENHPNN